MTPDTPASEIDTGENRREVRLPVLSDCALEPRTPAWTMLPAPLSGTTINITANGLRVVIPGFETDRYEKWCRHIDKGGAIGVTAELRDENGPIRIEGDIVWIGFTPEGDNAHARRGDCSVGILLSLVDEPTAARLRALGQGTS
ncbi:MAG: PilZ domain-containing protein [Candidatus Sumerlaeia bacterium]|nr:PilZ domain-containing protein [Candidatus Sumerlaeia bacterium]